ncbi:uncharacterized protein BP5553_03214 [Venustampulla echinocandica]|uniref:STEEP1 domain-containing protein n=1 Tax=Venustampulla echinocandica TaxID=2656787 RepID=A0A370TTP3_9HELO|nr:uncharacterized protein BP5553_03214 [Venustampulla echinocandica]RDL38874.1 hypothetical protein BP5553_03214 [Venustampulla echinocandica]
MAHDLSLGTNRHYYTRPVGAAFTLESEAPDPEEIRSLVVDRSTVLLQSINILTALPPATTSHLFCRSVSKSNRTPLTGKMAIQSPTIHNYHCICNSLLLSSTHTLSTLPRRSTSPNAGLDSALILPLPLPSSPTPFSTEEAEAGSDVADMPQEGYSIVLGMTRDSANKPTLLRREDGFEKRVLWRCGRCRIVVGYELLPSLGAVTGQGEAGERMDVDDAGIDEGKGKEGGRREEYRGKVLYILPGGLMSTDFMMEGKLGEADVDAGINAGTRAAFE